MSSDYLIRAVAANRQIRAFAATTRETVEFARQAHGTSPVATAALGRLMTAGAMMGSMMKGENDLLTLRMSGDGPMKGMLVTANVHAKVKGYVYEPGVMLPATAKGKLDVGGAVGRGTLRVIRDMGLKEPYVGQIELVSGEVAEDLTYYFAVSEQVPSSVALGVLMNHNNTVRRAGGFIIQLMPMTDESVIEELEKRLAVIPPVTAMLDQDMTPEQILEELLSGMELEINEKMPVGFCCDCNRERVSRALISTGKKELKAMIDDGEEVEAGCQFCNKKYKFSIKELEDLLKEAQGY